MRGLAFLCRPAHLAARTRGGAAAAALQRSVATEAGQLRRGDFFDFKGKKCVVMKASQQINNRKAFAIVEFREVESGNKHKETIQAGDKVPCKRGLALRIFVSRFDSPPVSTLFPPCASIRSDDSCPSLCAV